MSNQGVKTGELTMTGSAMNVELGFTPVRIDIFATESSVTGYWESNMRDGTFVVEDLGEVRSGEVLIGRHMPSIGTTTTQLANKRCVGYFDGAGATAVEIAAVAAGTAFTGGGAHDVATGSKWACFRLTAQTGGTKVITPSAALNYDTEALAIAALPAAPGNELDLGYCTIQSTAGAIWDATTDALGAGYSYPGDNGEASTAHSAGTAGTPAAVTNFYEGYGVMTGGITPYSTTFYGFTIGTAALLNIAGSRIRYRAYRS
jgi:hypothetical protein